MMSKKMKRFENAILSAEEGHSVIYHSETKAKAKAAYDLCKNKLLIDRVICVCQEAKFIIKLTASDVKGLMRFTYGNELQVLSGDVLIFDNGGSYTSNVALQGDISWDA